jgi:hypothetical protein
VNRPAIGKAPVPGAANAGRLFVWNGREQRGPKAGEYYLIGAKPLAYRADVDLDSECWIVTPLTAPGLSAEATTRGNIRALGGMINEGITGTFNYRGPDSWRELAQVARELAVQCERMAS